MSKINLGGVGGNRTLVQTGNTQDFYMLILLLVFDKKQRANTQFPAYLLRFSSRGRSSLGLIPAFLYPGIRRRGTEHLRSISLPYYTSGKRLVPTIIRIKLQERTLRCQLKVCSKGFKRSRYGSLHAYLPIGPAVETSQPQFHKCAKIRKIRASLMGKFYFQVF